MDSTLGCLEVQFILLQIILGKSEAPAQWMPEDVMDHLNVVHSFVSHRFMT